MATDHHTAKAGGIDAFIGHLEPYFTAKAPYQLPVSARQTIVEYGWIISLVLGIILIPAIVGLLGLMGVVGTVAYGLGIGPGPMYWLAGAALVVQTLFLFVAVPGLKNRSYAKGWKVVFYSQIFSAASATLHLSLGSLIGGAVSLIVGLFILFQIKSYYR